VRFLGLGLPVAGRASGFESADPFDVAACLGASWIASGPAGTVELLRNVARPDGLLLIGEVLLHEPPPAGGEDLLGGPEGVGTLTDTVERLETTGCEVVDMVLASADDWDRYQASQWRNVSEWLAANPDDDHAEDFRKTHRD
jgi:hypothetical protein